MAAKAASPLNDAAHWRVRFDKGQVVYDEGEPAQCMYRVDEGCVRLQVNGHDGERQIVCFLFPGDLFGFGVDRRVTAAEAATDVCLTRYSMRSVLDLEQRTPEVTIELMEHANALYADLAHHVAKITHLPAMERVIWFFQWLVRRNGGPRRGGSLMTPMSQKDIADYLSLKPETLSRALSALEAEGYLARKSRRTFILRGPMTTVGERSTDAVAALSAHQRSLAAEAEQKPETS